MIAFRESGCVTAMETHWSDFLRGVYNKRGAGDVDKRWECCETSGRDKGSSRQDLGKRSLRDEDSGWRD